MFSKSETNFPRRRVVKAEANQKMKSIIAEDNFTEPDNLSDEENRQSNKKCRKDTKTGNNTEDKENSVAVIKRTISILETNKEKIIYFAGVLGIF